MKNIINSLIKVSKYIIAVLSKLFSGRYSITLWYIVLAMITLIIIVLLTPSVYKTDPCTKIIENVYPEIYGLLFDVLLFGILLSIYQVATERTNSIVKETDIIDDFRGWDSNEASHRILGSVMRLQKLNVGRIDLNNCWFKEITLRDLCFIDSQMTNLVFINTEIYNTIFHKIQSKIITFRNSEISGCSFENGKIKFYLYKSNISSTLFHEIDISSSLFYADNLSHTLFSKVNFSHSSLSFKKCNGVEFSECLFDECIVGQNFFEEISDPKNFNIGYQQITQEYDLINEVNSISGSTNPIWILRSKQKGKVPNPVINIEPDAVIVLNNPWERLGRCQQIRHFD